MESDVFDMTGYSHLVLAGVAVQSLELIEVRWHMTAIVGGSYVSQYVPVSNSVSGNNGTFRLPCPTPYASVVGNPTLANGAGNISVLADNRPSGPVTIPAQCTAQLFNGNVGPSGGATAYPPDYLSGPATFSFYCGVDVVGATLVTYDSNLNPVSFWHRDLTANAWQNYDVQLPPYAWILQLYTSAGTATPVIAYVTTSPTGG